MLSLLWQHFWIGPWFVGSAHCHAWWIRHGICVEHEHRGHRFHLLWCSHKGEYDE